MTAAVSELRLLVPPAACVLGADGVDAVLGEDTLHPGQHQLLAGGAVTVETRSENL